MDKTLYTLIVHSENIAGLLNQITAVFTRRQINIESLNVSASSIKGVHKYTITVWTTQDVIEKVVKQIEKKIDVLQAHYFTDSEIYQHEIALYKVSTPEFQENPMASKVIRRYSARIVEVNPVFSIVEKNGMSEEITAGFHAADRGFGIATLNENHYTWVLSRLAVELENMPCQYEGFSIQTWVENVYRLFTDRNFAILDKEGKAVGYARSVWAMISMETRKPADLLTLHGGSITDYVCDKECPISKPGRIKVTEKTPVSEYQTRYSDIDINGHVNSIKYIEHILDLFPIEFFKEKRIKRFEMAYVAESYYGDILSFYREEVGEKEYDIEVKKNGTDVVVRSKVIFI